MIRVPVIASRPRSRSRDLFSMSSKSSAASPKEHVHSSASAKISVVAGETGQNENNLAKAKSLNRDLCDANLNYKFHKLHRTNVEPNIPQKVEDKTQNEKQDENDTSPRKNEKTNNKTDNENNNDSETPSSCATEATTVFPVVWRDPLFMMYINRDYSGKNGTNVMGIRFKTSFPTQLIGSVAKDEFENTIDTVNEIFARAESIGWGTTLESLLWYSTCTLAGLCKKTRMEKAMAEIQDFLYEQNRTVYHPIGLHVAHPLSDEFRRITIRNISRYGLYKNVGKKGSSASQSEA